MQIEDEEFCRERIVEEQLRAQTTTEPHLRELHLGLATLYQERLLELRRRPSIFEH